MAEASIPVDLLNPGHVFASLGILELVEQTLGQAEGAFDWSEPTAPCFHVRAAGDVSPVEYALRFLEGAEVESEAVEGSPNLEKWTASWGTPPCPIPRGNGYPFPDPDSPATLVCSLISQGQRISIDHWGDETERDNMKFWAGAAGYPGAALARDALELIRGRAVAAAADPFNLAAIQSSSFRLDWRRDYIPIEAGFSLNKQKKISILGYPLVELLGVIGLTNARPRRPRRRDKLIYDYGVIGRDASLSSLWLSPPLLRAALGTACLPFPSRTFRMFLDWPGQENQARAITSVIEVNNEESRS